MERPEAAVTGHNDLPPSAARVNNGRIFIAVIILFHAVGLTGLSVPSLRPLFLNFVPWHILLMFVLILFNHQGSSRRFFTFVALLSVSGFLAEYAGVHTNVLFGHYHYGKTLGIKAFGVPLTMGVNWFLLVYAAGTSAAGLSSKWFRVAAGALLLVLLDLLIEPAAMRLDYWHWQDNRVPVMNYVCWFLVSFVMLGIFGAFNFKRQNNAGLVLLLCQVVFFSVLIFVLY